MRVPHLRAPGRCAAGPLGWLNHRFLSRDSRQFTSQSALRAKSEVEPCDLVLSSGFLSFASHCGFLAAVDDAGIPVAGVMGTSAGAITGSLFAAGYTPQAAGKELSAVAPMTFITPNAAAPWQGLMLLGGVVERLSELLPATFEELERDFAVGVVDSSGRHLIIDSGPLPEAVAASAAVPVLFAPLHVPGLATSPCRDGGMEDRVGLRIWRDRRREQHAASDSSDAFEPPHALLHVITRSSPFSGKDDLRAMGEDPDSMSVVRSPKASVSLTNLGPFEEQMTAAQSRTEAMLTGYLQTRRAIRVQS